MNFKKCINFHCHTQRCGHAVGCEADYARAAHDAGITILGFSDHAPTPENAIPTSMPFEQLDEYIAAVRAEGKMYPDLKVLLGAEVERAEKFGFAEIEKLYKKEKQLDYLIGAVHVIRFDDDNSYFQGTQESDVRGCLRILRENIEMIESGLFICIAHPDFFGAYKTDWTPEYEEPVRKLISAAIKHDVYLEVNAYGMRKKQITTPSGITRWQYPQKEFWQIAKEMGAKVVLGMDAHDPVDLSSNWFDALAWLENSGLVCRNDEMAERILSQCH